MFHSQSFQLGFSESETRQGPYTKTRMTNTQNQSRPLYQAFKFLVSRKSHLGPLTNKSNTLKPGGRLNNDRYYYFAFSFTSEFRI